MGEYLKGRRRKDTWVVDRGWVAGEREQEKGRQCQGVKNEETQKDCLSSPIPENPNVHHSDTRAVSGVTLCPVAQQAKSVAARESIENVTFLRSVSVSRLRVFL